MTQLISLNNHIHQSLKVDERLCMQDQANTHMVPVMLSEFQKLSVIFPILLTKNSETGRFVCVSLLGFREGENLFWENGEMDVIYLPLNLARQPFYLGQSEDDEELVVCVDADNQGVQEESGQALFDEDGGQTQFMNNISAMLSALWEGESKTREFIETLVDLDLLHPIRLEMQFLDKSKGKVNGLYTVDEEKMKNLSIDVLKTLHNKDYLLPIYTLINSMGHIYSLIEKKNSRIAARPKGST